MARLSDKVVALPAGAYLPTSNFFMASSIPAYWDSCRVTFHQHYYRACKTGNECVSSPFFYVVSAEKQIQQIVDTVTEAENQLRVPVEHQAEFNPCREHIISVTPGKWWLDPIRFTFLTAILRDINVDLQGTLDNPIGRYFKITREATSRFLAGNTFYHGDRFLGWVEQFSKTSRYSGDKSKDVVLLQDKPAKGNTVECCHHPGWAWEAIPLVKF